MTKIIDISERISIKYSTDGENALIYKRECGGEISYVLSARDLEDIAKYVLENQPIRIGDTVRFKIDVAEQIRMPNGPDGVVKHYDAIVVSTDHDGQVLNLDRPVLGLNRVFTEDMAIVKRGK